MAVAEKIKISSDLNESQNYWTTTAGALIIGSLLISIAILLSGGVINLKGGVLGSKIAANPSTAPQTTTDTTAAENTEPVKVSFDDDPVLGNIDAKVTMVEFSDYECPFCKRYFESTYPDIKKDYIDTGKIKLIYRDLPLSFHANAAKEAEAANCAKEQGGDSAYFKFHDEMFTKTTSNGTGLSIDELPTLAQNVGLNGPLLKTCLDSGKYKAEVDKDLADAEKYGASGTPTFFIGKSGDGEVNGQMLVGAQPFSAFQKVIDAALAE